MKDKIILSVILSITLCTLFAGNLFGFQAMADGGNSTNNNTTNSTTLHSVTVALTANPVNVNLGGHTIITATVTDNSNSSIYPTGSILWSSGNANGTLTPSSCTLSSGTCTTSFTPSANSPNTVTITASYAGNSIHNNGTASKQLTTNVMRPTTTAVTPNSPLVSTGGSVSFVATVTDTTAFPTTLNGTISWSAGTAGGTFTLSSCNLSSGTCTTSFTPSLTSPIAVTITATFAGDSTHSGSAGVSYLTVNVLHSTATTITKNTALPSAGPISFVVKVNDTSTTKTTPTGTVSWTDGNAAGTFNVTSCTISSGKCAFLYTLNANAPNVVTINATYPGDSTHLHSSGILQLSTNTLYGTTTTVTPNPGLVVSGNATTLTATVADTSNPSANLIGIASWSDNGAGGTFSLSSCILSSNHCSITYTPPSNPSSITITVTYAGDSTHSGSSGTSSLTTSVSTTSTPPSPPTQTTPPPTQLPTSSQGIITATQQDIANISEAKSNDTIAAEVNIVNQTVQTTSIDNNVLVNTSDTSSDSLSVTVSASNQTSPKVILINLDATTINIANLKDLGVMYDGAPIAPAVDVNSVLHAKSTGSPSFAIIITQNGAQILISIPHFSTHTITVTNISKVIPAVPEFPFAVPVLIVGIASLIVFYRMKFAIRF